MLPKKSLGQNFFINKNLCKQIIDIVMQEGPNLLVEIGPGTGSFTTFFSKESIDLILIEKDAELSNTLSTLFPEAEIKNCDFLDWNLEKLGKEKKGKIIFFGSLPYNLSKQIIRKIVESPYFKNPAYFIIQKEVAEKYITKEPDNNLLSLNTQLYADVKRLFNISPDSFRPKPKVNSSFVVFTPKENNLNVNIRDFKKFLKSSFTQPRKTLRNNLKNSFTSINKNEGSDKVNKLLSKRPQHLSLKEYLFLYNNL
jgi:16S rRNA (adenine1518-N6/adenine1519-N6)-dimethyltransferase